MNFAAAANSADVQREEPERPGPSRKLSRMSSNSQQAQYKVKELNFGFSVDVNRESLNRLTSMVHSDKYEENVFPAADLTHAVDDLEQEGNS